MTLTPERRAEIEADRRAAETEGWYDYGVDACLAVDDLLAALAAAEERERNLTIVIKNRDVVSNELVKRLEEAEGRVKEMEAAGKDYRAGYQKRGDALITAEREVSGWVEIEMRLKRVDQCFRDLDGSLTTLRAELDSLADERRTILREALAAKAGPA